MKYSKACLLLTIISIHLRTKFDFCVLKFEFSLAQALISEFFGKKSVRYLAPVIWISRPWDTETIATFYDFK